MSYATSLNRYATKAARERAAVYGGSLATSTANAAGNNFRLDTTEFRAPFVDAFEREITDFGEKLVVSGTLLVRDALGLTLAQGDELTHLASSTTWVIESMRRPPGAVERRCGLRRVET